MNDFVLTQILAENEKLERELESSKQAVKASEVKKKKKMKIKTKNKPRQSKLFKNLLNNQNQNHLIHHIKEMNQIHFTKLHQDQDVALLCKKKKREQ